VKLALQGAGLVKKRKPARDPPGGAARDGCYRECCCTWDVSKHAWFQDGRYYRLITILDDATSEIYYAQLVAEEGTRMLMPAIREVIEKDPHIQDCCAHTECRVKASPHVSLAPCGLAFPGPIRAAPVSDMRGQAGSKE